MIKNDIYLPDEFEKDREKLEKSLRRIINIETTKINEVKPLSVYKSKFGGNPYFPIEMDYPVNQEGEPLYLLAQINFEEINEKAELSEEIEKDEYLKHLPTKGILSFFVDYYDDLIGSNLGDLNAKSSYKVIYFPEIEKDESKLISDFSFLEQESDNFYPVVDGEYSLNYRILDQLVTLESKEWEDVIEKDSFEYIEELNLPELVGDDSKERSQDKVWEEYSEAYSAGHQIGGYPFFTQEDPRSYNEELEKYNFLLFQLDTDGEIMWGDSGIGNFFMNFDKLKQKDFSDVLYTWDCY